MIVDIKCNKCNESFNGHWHIYTDLKYTCPKCGNNDASELHIQTDEVYDNE